MDKLIKEIILEFLTYKLRSIIYVGEHKRVAQEIVKKKIIKVKAIGDKLNQKTIIDSPKDMKAFINNEFWQKRGLPRLQYNTAEQERVQGNYDKWYLMQRGTQVEYDGELCTILRNDPSTDILQVNCQGKRINLRYEDVSLIIPEELYI